MGNRDRPKEIKKKKPKKAKPPKGPAQPREAWNPNQSRPSAPQE